METRDLSRFKPLYREVMQSNVKITTQFRVTQSSAHWNFYNQMIITKVMLHFWVVTACKPLSKRLAMTLEKKFFLILKNALF